MVQAKSILFDEELSTNAKYFKALAHPARLQILLFLASSESCITGDISNQVPLGRTTVNQHLKELKDIGLIQGHTEGVKTKYCLNPEEINKLKEAIREFMDSLNTNNYKCS